MNKAVLLDFVKKNVLGLCAVVLAFLSLIIALGFNAKMLEGRFNTLIQTEVKKGINREMDGLGRDSRAIAKEEVGKVEGKITELEKNISDLKQLQGDTDSKSNDVSNRLLEIQSKLDTLEQKLNQRPSSAIAPSKPKKAAAGKTKNKKKK